jgi:predicted ribosome quality control (RQC) complex YloA/Tae2 family protein
MPIRYDSVLVGALARELVRTVGGRRVEELHFEPGARQVQVVFNGGEQLVWMLHPAAGQVQIQAGDRRGKARRARGRGVLRRAARVTDVTAGPDERRLVIQLSAVDGIPTDRPAREGGGPESLVFELHTNQWNALLVTAGVIRAVVWPRRAGDRLLIPGSEYLPPEGGRLWSDSMPDPEVWERWWNRQLDGDRGRALLREVAWVSRLNVEYVLGSDLATGQEACSALTRLGALRTAGSGEPPPDGELSAWSLVRGGALQPYPLALDEAEAEPHESLLDAMAAAAERDGVGPSGRPARPGQGEEATHLEAALQQSGRRARKRCQALERQLDQGDGSAALRSAGQLLLMNKGRIRRGDPEAVVEDFDGAERRIPLDPAADALANAEDYFRRARRREKAERELPARIDAARSRLSVLEEALSELLQSGPTDDLWLLAGGRPAAGPSTGTPGGPGSLLPYRRLVSSGGLEIRVGRSARANDALTFRNSAPDDIWLHARQAAGAHVILRWGNREQNPPEADLRDAALAAADSSEARSSGLVAVDWTRRKYVRKPRKSAPGAVIPDRVKTLFVEPDPARVRQMKDAGPDAP